jgi:polar amino acid transport system substrate-binding protein
VHAAEQLECVPALRRVARILRHQLERYDGLGSADGLRGDRIPLGSRVLAIASSFDLLTTCAPELDCQEALQQLAGARGEVFDPWLLDLFDEEIRREPPAGDSDRPVMIVPAGSLPWRLDAEATGDVDDDGSFVAEDLEVMHDDSPREDAP